MNSTITFAPSSKNSISGMDISQLREILDRIPPVKPLPDEIEALKDYDTSIALEGTVAYEDVDWGD